MNFPISKLSLGVLLAGSLSFSAVNAEELHAGDFQPYLSGGKVQLNTTSIEANFGDLAGGAYSTDDPGFDADTGKGAFGAGNWLQYQGLANLKFWDGDSWDAVVPNGEYVEIRDALDNVTTFTTSGIANPFGVIGQFDASANLHEHLDFSIKNSSNVLGVSIGAYWISLSLLETSPYSTTALNTPSDVANIVFNRGLNTEAYEAAVAGVSAVPVPAAVWLFGTGLIAFFGLSKRKQLVA